jgi:hypothetical protein
MRRFEPKKKKVDVLFISITAVAIIVVALLSWVFQKPDFDDRIIISELPETSQEVFGKLVISEVMSNNGGIYVNSNNQLRIMLNYIMAQIKRLI